ncbi:hypothetical protein PIROE2DRAFT_1537 [Piromyces sp. E2]|nr:hypothetical protein PIROE2DRAFT_1537 [Piromyces sp. E2]|eukprot:OUM70380.1 hypothetical protein PIROE2DRAFT_1537 [Piromyces sp. E2]
MICNAAKVLPVCDQVANPREVCRTGAGEGEVCQHTDGKFYESGKEACFEYRDRTGAKLQYFNTAYRHILPETTITTEPIVYECTPENLPECYGNPATGVECQKASEEVVPFCIKSGKVYKTGGGKCQSYTPSDGELLGCVVNKHELPVCEQVADTSKACMAQGKDDTYCFDDDSDTLYITKDGKCKLYTDEEVVPDTATKYFYFDKEFRLISSVGETAKIYTGYGCVKVPGTDPVTCEVIEVRAEGELIRTPTTVGMCLSGGAMMSLTTQTPPEYRDINAGAYKFAGITGGAEHKVKATGKSIVKIGVAVNLATCKAAANCNDGTNEVDACIFEDVIYVNVDGTCGKLTYTGETAPAVVFFGRDHTKANSYTYVAASDISTDTTLHLAYKCTFDGTKKATACEKVTGYAITDSYLMSCSGLEGDACTVQAKGSDATCTTGEGLLNTGGASLCFGSRKVDLPTAEGIKYVAFKATQDHEAFTAAAGKLVMLELAKDYAMVMNAYKVNGGKVNGGKVKGGGVKGGGVNGVGVNRGKVNGGKVNGGKVNGVGGTVTEDATLYFVNEANPTIGEDSLSEPLIKIIIASHVVDTDNSGVIVKGDVTPDTPTYYLDGTSPKNVITCQWGGACESHDYISDLPETTGAGTTRYFISTVENKNNKLITCGARKSDGTCGESSSLSFSISTNVYYYVDAGDATGKSVIKCDNESHCQSIRNVPAGIFISSSTTYGEGFVKCPGNGACTYANTAFSESDTLSFKYDSDQFKYRSGASSFAVIDGVHEGYEKLTSAQAGTVWGGSGEALVHISKTAIVKVNTASGYYKRVGVATALDKALIQCLDGLVANCGVTTPTPGYYVSASNRMAVWNCASSNGCVEEKVKATSCTRK